MTRSPKITKSGSLERASKRQEAIPGSRRSLSLDFSRVSRLGYQHDASPRVQRGATFKVTPEMTLERAQRLGHRPATLRLFTKVAQEQQPRRIQRFAFINEQQIRSGGKGDLKRDSYTPDQQSFIDDKIVRDYLDRQELERHVAMKTDHIGTLTNRPDRFWVRFSETPTTNIIGESHDRTTLKDVLTAVRSSNYIYEGFMDIPREFKKTRASYDEEVKPISEGFPQTSGRQTSGRQTSRPQSRAAEDLIPKMGYAMAEMQPYFNTGLFWGTFSSLRGYTFGSLQSGYAGVPYQRYLKISWYYARDLEERWKAPGSDLPKPKMAKLIKEINSLGELDVFMKSLEVGKNLGDALGQKKNYKYLEPLRRFAQAFTDALFEIIKGEAASRSKKSKGFYASRDASFLDHVRKAISDGRRYIGMGADHLTALPKDLQGEFQQYDLTGDAGMGFVKKTEELKNKAQSL